MDKAAIIAVTIWARYDSYYERWLDYKRANNREETLSMEKRMQEVMRQHQVPITVPLRERAQRRPWPSPAPCCCCGCFRH